MLRTVHLLTLVFAFVCYATIQKVNTIGRTHPRNNNDQPMLVSDIYAASDYFYGQEMTVEPMPEAIDPDNVPTLNVKHGLSSSCTEKICDMFYYALTCKALDLGFNKECASYFLGANFDCPQFPAPSEFFNAPSVCAVQMAGLAASLVTGDILGLMETYLGQTFQTNTCGRHCYQNYQYASNDFYSNCYFELLNNVTLQNTYLVATKIMNFQEFRNQACAVNNNNTNCYQQFTAPTTSTIDVFNMECNYVGMPSTAPAPYVTKNNLVFAGLCTQFTSYECCTANDVTMYQQSQTNASNISLFPPCLLSYLTNNCPGVDLTNYCQNGSMASVATVLAELSIKRAVNGVSQRFLFPDMYNKTSVNQLQAAISGVLSLLGGNTEPWQFNPHYPFQVQILSYVYYSASGVALTPLATDGSGLASGTPVYPLGSDYDTAETITVQYQVTLQNTVSLAQASAFLNTNLASEATFGLAIGVVYSGYPPTFNSNVSIVQPTTWFEAQPLELPPNSAFSILNGHTTVVLGVLLTTLSTVWLSAYF